MPGVKIPIKVIAITDFNKIVNDTRSRANGAMQTLVNFDTLTNQKKITPYRSCENGDTNSETDLIANFCYTNSAVYALANDGLNPITILKKTDLTTSTWGSFANNTGAITAVREVFVPYHGLIYGLNGSRNGVWAVDPTGSASFNPSVQGLSGGATHAAQGLVHSKDDILYIPWGNNIASNNNGSWQPLALVLPSELYITSICEFGNYLAIGCAPISGLGKSVVYLWDRDSSLTTLSEVIDFGEGILQILENLSGTLVGISLSAQDRFNDRVIFRTYTAGDKAELFEEFVGGTIDVLPQAKQIINNRLYFMMDITINGNFYAGTWSIGRIAPGQPLGVVQERTLNNDVAFVGNGALFNFIFVGDYLFQAYTDDSANYQVTKTDDQPNYLQTSIVETLINPEMPENDRYMQKQLQGVALTYDSFPTGGQVTLKVAVDGGAWVIAFTQTTVAQNTEAPSALGIPFTDGRDYEFRIESKGGVEITALIYKYATLNTIINP